LTIGDGKVIITSLMTGTRIKLGRGGGKPSGKA